MRRRVKKSSLNYYRLEMRQLLAGNVAVTQSGGVLNVTGDAQANEIQIFGTANGGATLVGTAGTTINGGTSSFVVESARSETGSGTVVENQLR